MIKAKANHISANAYLTSSEIIPDLKNMFGELNKVAKSDALLHNNMFDIAVSNAKETFDVFLVRLYLDFVPRDYRNCYKISNSWKTLSKRLYFMMSDSTTYTSFSQMSHVIVCVTWIFVK